MVDIYVGKLITTSSQRVEYLEFLHDNKHKNVDRFSKIVVIYNISYSFFYVICFLINLQLLIILRLFLEKQMMEKICLHT